MSFADVLAAEFAAGGGRCQQTASFDAALVCGRAGGHQGPHAAAAAAGPVQWMEPTGPPGLDPAPSPPAGT